MLRVTRQTGEDLILVLPNKQVVKILFKEGYVTRDGRARMKLGVEAPDNVQVIRNDAARRFGHA